MTNQFNILKTSRKITLKVIENLSLEQLHTIPKGFKNNIIWNLTHLVVTQQLLHYKLSGLECLISKDLIQKYTKGTVPSEKMSANDFETVKELFLKLPETLEENYNAGVFKEYHTYNTSTGYVLDSIETAVPFNNFHEGLHLGTIMALKKLV